MRCKIFTVPLSSQGAFEGERQLSDFVNFHNVKRVFASVVNPPEGPAWSVLFFYEGDEQPAATAPAKSEAAPEFTPPLTGEQVRGMIALKKWRADQASQEGVPLYMVAQNKWLEEIVRLPVKGMDDLTKVRGLSGWRVQKYGPKILEALNAGNAAKRTWQGPSYSPGRA